MHPTYRRTRNFGRGGAAARTRFERHLINRSGTSHRDLVRGIGVFQLRHRWALSGASARDGVGNHLRVGCGQFKGHGTDPAVNCWGDRPPTMAPAMPGHTSVQATAMADTVVR